MTSWLGLILAAAVSIAAWTIWRSLARRAQARRRYSPHELFCQLCEAHGLDRTQRRALCRLAQQQQLEHPGRLFLEPERFEAGEGPVLAKIKERLFADSAAAAAE